MIRNLGLLECKVWVGRKKSVSVVEIFLLFLFSGVSKLCIWWQEGQGAKQNASEDFYKLKTDLKGIKVQDFCLELCFVKR